MNTLAQRAEVVPSNKRRAMWLSAILVAVCLYAFDVDRLENTSGDNISARYWPIAVLKHHTYKLNHVKTDLKDVAYTAIYTSAGDWIPRADLGMLIITLPFYVAFETLGLISPDWTHKEISYASRWCAILWVTLSVLGLFWLTRRFVPDSTAFVSALLFALGTYSWSLGSQGISTQTVAVLLHITSLFLIWPLSSYEGISEGRRIKLGLLLGLLCGFAWTCRPSTLFMVVAPVLLFRSWRSLGAYIAGILTPILPTLLVYREIYDDYLGWRGVLTKLTTGTNSSSDWLFQGNPLVGLPGILLSPNRGAIVFFPLLLLVPYLWFKLMPGFDIKAMFRSLLRYRLPAWRAQSRNGITEAFSGTLAIGASSYLLATTLLGEWHGSWGYGPRYLFDIQPYVWVPLTLGLEQVRRTVLKLGERQISRWASILIVLFSLQGVVVHYIGHRNFDIYVWNSRGNVGGRVWDFSDFIVKETWNTEPHAERWPDQLVRFRRLGY